MPCRQWWLNTLYCTSCMSASSSTGSSMLSVINPNIQGVLSHAKRIRRCNLMIQSAFALFEQSLINIHYYIGMPDQISFISDEQFWTRKFQSWMTIMLTLWSFSGSMRSCVEKCSWITGCIESVSGTKVSELARRFVEGYMHQVIGILVQSKQPLTIWQQERSSCVEVSLEFTTVIIANDIKIQQKKRKGERVFLASSS